MDKYYILLFLIRLSFCP